MPRSSRKQVYDDEYDARFYSHLVPQGQVSKTQNNGGSKRRLKKKKRTRKRSRDHSEKPQTQKSLVDYDDISSDSDIISVSPSESRQTQQATRTGRPSNYDRHGHHYADRRAQSPPAAAAHRQYRDGRSRSRSPVRDESSRSWSESRPKNKKVKRLRQRSPTDERRPHIGHGHQDAGCNSSAHKTKHQTYSKDVHKEYMALPKAYIADFKETDDKRHNRSPSPYFKHVKKERRLSRSPVNR